MSPHSLDLSLGCVPGLRRWAHQSSIIIRSIKEARQVSESYSTSRSPTNTTSSHIMSSALFQPIKIGNISLAHRVALAPVTRFRSDASYVHSSGHGLTYYTQRCTPGGLLITEATLVHPRGGGRPHMPCITTEAQISAWKKVRPVYLRVFTL